MTLYGVCLLSPRFPVAETDGSLLSRSRGNQRERERELFAARYIKRRAIKFKLPKALVNRAEMQRASDNPT